MLPLIDVPFALAVKLRLLIVKFCPRFVDRLLALPAFMKTFVSAPGGTNVSLPLAALRQFVV